jgi:prophage regulatory protein
MDDELISLDYIIGSKKKGIKPIIPVSRTAWYDGVKDGRFPKPMHLSARRTVWFRSDVLTLLEKLKSERANNV